MLQSSLKTGNIKILIFSIFRLNLESCVFDSFEAYVVVPLINRINTVLNNI